MTKGLSKKESGYKSRLKSQKEKVAGWREWPITSNATKKSSRMKSAYLIYKNTNDFGDGSF